MAPFNFSTFFNAANRVQSKSSALAPLCWLLGLIISGLVTSVGLGAPSWLVVVLSVASVLTVIFFFFFYAWFAIKRPDYLRSETFFLTKLAIEKNLIGDNRTGLIEVGDKEDLALLPAKDDDAK